jgi:hypothetical protein|tara:strand:- start:48918 stop:49610 length:693 start_codon:yes stop_codon:yes gene_type:complete
MSSSDHSEKLDHAPALAAFIRDEGFPCVGAKSALAKDNIDILNARDIRSAWDDLVILRRLHEFAARYVREGELFTSFAVIFDGPLDLDELAFETALWDRVQSLHDKDEWKGKSWDESVDSNPGASDFSLSLGGQAFFIVGLHPNASRAARRFSQPTLIFNLHDQFERLRADGRYEKLRETILARDLAANGSINPMLARHGSVSEARQYSGRAVGEDWVCPFQPHRLKAMA